MRLVFFYKLQLGKISHLRVSMNYRHQIDIFLSLKACFLKKKPASFNFRIYEINLLQGISVQFKLVSSEFRFCCFNEIHCQKHQLKYPRNINLVIKFPTPQHWRFLYEIWEIQSFQRSVISYFIFSKVDAWLFSSHIKPGPLYNTPDIQKVHFKRPPCSQNWVITYKRH